MSMEETYVVQIQPKKDRTGTDLWVLIAHTVATEVHLPPAKLSKYANSS